MIFFSPRSGLLDWTIVTTVYILKVKSKSVSPSQVLPLFSSGVIQTPPARSSTKTSAVQLQLLLLLFLVDRGFLWSLETPKHLFNREMRHVPFSKTRMTGVVLKDLVKFSHIDPVDPRQSTWASVGDFGPHWPMFFSRLVLAVLQNRGVFDARGLSVRSALYQSLLTTALIIVVSSSNSTDSERGLSAS